MKTRNLAIGGLLLACAVLLPQALHMIGGPGLGGTFLPMHIPVLIAGYFISPWLAFVLGLLSPICSFIYTGGAMPAIPMLYLMMGELSIYGLSCAYLYQFTKKNIYISLIGAMILGRLSRAGIFLILTKLFGLALPPAMGISAAILSGIPGIIVQLIFIPTLVWILIKGKDARHDS